MGRQAGFTLLETLVVLAIMLVIMGISLGVGFDLLPKLYHADARETAVRILIRARTLVFTRQIPTEVMFSTGVITLSLNSDFDDDTENEIETFPIDPRVVWSDEQTVRFNPEWGITSNTATVTLSFNQASQTIQINHEAAISW